MALKIKQDFTYRGDDWWKWWVWVDGPQEELNQIDHVTYTLHPTFPNPVRTVKDRNSNFRLETGGWGVFQLFAKAVKKDGEEIHLAHDLQLKYPDGTSTTR
jgi:transcription initiation factor IIF auxiliary subunit